MQGVALELSYMGERGGPWGFYSAGLDLSKECGSGVGSSFLMGQVSEDSQGNVVRESFPDAQVRVCTFCSPTNYVSSLISPIHVFQPKLSHEWWLPNLYLQASPLFWTTLIYLTSYPTTPLVIHQSHHTQNWTPDFAPCGSFSFCPSVSVLWLFMLCSWSQRANLCGLHHQSFLPSGF